MSGVLQNNNVDAGIRVFINNCRGQPLWSWDSRETERSFEYDELRRLQQVNEKEKAGDWQRTEFLCYGKSNPQGNNTVGRLLEHYDPSGKKKILKYSVLGQVLQESCSYLKSGENVSWSQAKEKNNSFLENLNYLSRWTNNALGETISQVDACENEQKTFYDIAGQVSQINLRMKDQTKERVVRQGHVYAANGRIKEEQPEDLNLK